MRRILIANRGEIARRVIATARRMGIDTVAIYSDADAAALHVREATVAYALGGNTPRDSYLRVDKMLAAAKATGADAVHPGYGFLSEDAGFAQAVQDAGLSWIGPPPAAIRALGSKAAAKALAAQQGVPCLPGYAGDDQGEARFVAEAAKISYPVMVKAVAGGGGRGMRLVTEAAQLPQALKRARSEALAGFGNGELLIERAVLHPRHVEVQVFADTHGQVIHLGERDCSVQRRHQKIVEEAPSPAVSPELRARMGRCAVALAQGAGYVGAGTVEFLVEGNDFFLMEMNTRLQVEHPVTEAITGLDLVEWQIRVARGEPLPLAQDEVQLHGHAIEVRLCAEDEHYVPHAGRIRHFAAPPAAAFERAPLRFDHAIEAGGEVTPYYDAMLGKLIVHAPTRAEAIDRLIGALAQTELLGLPSNRGFLMECLQDARYQSGEALISFLAEHGDALREQLLKKERLAHEHCALAVVYPQETGPLPCAFAAPLRLSHRGEVSALTVRAVAGGVQLLGEPARTIALQALADGAVQCAEDGVTRRVRAALAPAADAPRRWHAQAGGVDWWIVDASFDPVAGAGQTQAATELRAPFNGKVVRVAAVVGQALAAGETAVVIESMKLEHSVAPRADAAVAELLVTEGQQVTPGQVLLRFAAPPVVDEAVK
ncbi:MAG: biotin/lipoyl-binding protein [Burkholderiales bacterium]|uniref:Acetyl/propionyl/methylcrotonyl-CoA carboxylase subunit alpha n=1 Tax=Ottowia pentelensis TaxID=511108 RepID=A0ABV6PR77_9BURK|nr:biotin carboxylase N-terminal domain-containing protein [Ottowia sp.]MBN9404172.1 biotin/lipoyl-binding protein [Burkholderiales bacterium]MBS0401873.1 biotin/lipoyl-binding protein [Pseudomonadota bacterium]MBS0413620.1 biotin/lipoyl-binding protein [Pseudomonadota bacterium]